MKKKTEWETFFDGHAPIYMDNCFTKNTEMEAGFIVEELQLSPGAAILDIGCGTGRHAIELARRGYQVTGVDISAGMLDQAGKHAKEAKVEVTWIHANATEFSVDRRFDGAICLCEGAFGLLGNQDDALEQPLAILGRIAASLKPRARCLFTVLNGFAIARKYSQSDVEKGLFEPLTLSEVSECSPEGEDTGRIMKERGFVPTEIDLLFRMSGLKVRHIWGGTAGDWQRDIIKLDEIEIMVVGEKAVE